MCKWTRIIPHNKIVIILCKMVMIAKKYTFFFSILFHEFVTLDTWSQLLAWCPFYPHNSSSQQILPQITTKQIQYFHFFAFIFANRKIAFLVLKKTKTKNIQPVFNQIHRQDWERNRQERENWMMMIREYRSGCRSVEAAWGGSDTKTALVQTDKRICLSVCFEWVSTLLSVVVFKRVKPNVSIMLRDKDQAMIAV